MSRGLCLANLISRSFEKNVSIIFADVHAAMGLSFDNGPAFQPRARPSSWAHLRSVGVPVEEFKPLVEGSGHDRAGGSRRGALQGSAGSHWGGAEGSPPARQLCASLAFGIVGAVELSGISADGRLARSRSGP